MISGLPVKLNRAVSPAFRLSRSALTENSAVPLLKGLLQEQAMAMSERKIKYFCMGNVLIYRTYHPGFWVMALLMLISSAGIGNNV